MSTWKKNLAPFVALMFGVPLAIASCSDDDTGTGGSGGQGGSLEAGTGSGGKAGGAGGSAGKADAGPDAASGGAAGSDASTGTGGAAGSQTGGSAGAGGGGSAGTAGSEGGVAGGAGTADAGSGGSAGADGGSDGSAGAAGAEAGTGGTTDAGSDVTSPADAEAGASLCQTGCAVASAAMFTPDSGYLTQPFMMVFPATDLTSARVTANLCVASGSGGFIQLYVQNDSGSYALYNPGSAAVYDLSTIRCSTGMHAVNLDLPAATTNDFAPATTGRVGMAIGASPQAVVTNPTVIYIDSFTFTNVPGGGTLGPFDFAPAADGGQNLQGFAKTVWGSPDIGSVSWIGPQ